MIVVIELLCSVVSVVDEQLSIESFQKKKKKIYSTLQMKYDITWRFSRTIPDEWIEPFGHSSLNNEQICLFWSKFAVWQFH